ncbi:MAG: hypothetical protein SV375_01655 [Thermodesulfobacteriota bacterium]|nr:hypothetical protein [Thermodesulfobacteriota bacterium]
MHIDGSLINAPSNKRPYSLCRLDRFNLFFEIVYEISHQSVYYEKMKVSSLLEK